MFHFYAGVPLTVNDHFGFTCALFVQDMHKFLAKLHFFVIPCYQLRLFACIITFFALLPRNIWFFPTKRSSHLFFPLLCTTFAYFKNNIPNGNYGNKNRTFCNQQHRHTQMSARRKARICLHRTFECGEIEPYKYAHSSEQTGNDICHTRKDIAD